MLVLFCVKLCKLSTIHPIEEKRKKQQLSIANKQMICGLTKKAKNLNLKNLVDKIHKKLKLNVDHHIKIGINHNPLQI
jgi:3-dehydroquinate dehydratase